MPARPKHWVFFVGGQIEHDYGRLAHRLQQATAAVSGRIRLSGSARVVAWQRLIERIRLADPRRVVEEMITSLQAKNWNHPYAAEFRALAEARVFATIVNGLGAALSPNDLRCLVGGTLHAAAEGENAPARDRQFELFVAAVARFAGMKPRLEEPDVVVDLNGVELGLAAKRVRSKKQLDKKLAKAQHQITGTRRPGIAFLDVTRLLDRTAEIITHWTRAESMLGGHLLALEREHSTSLRGELPPLVEGIVLYVSLPHLGRRFRIGTSELWWPVRGPNGEVPPRVMEFMHRFADGTRHPDVLIRL